MAKGINKIFTYSLVAVAFVAITVVLLYFFLSPRPESPAPTHTITNFQECAAAGYPVGESYPRQCWTPDGKHFVEEISDDPLPEPASITITGTIDCLPKRGSGPQTLECAIGLRAENGLYYGLKNLATLDPENRFSAGGLPVIVTGMVTQEDFRGPDGNRYDIVGVVELSSIIEAAQ